MLQCLTLWVGERLGPVERACLRSILRQGHSLALYCYTPPAGVPPGIELRDASEILHHSFVFRHRKGGSVAPFSDWFRYELQRRGAGTWVDIDVYLLAPLDQERCYLFGEQAVGLLNNAILRVPRGSPVLGDLLEPFTGVTPSWLPLRDYVPARVREILTGRTELSRLPWGATGPAALTAAARKFGVSSKALPPPVFYPVPWQDASWILDPRLKLEALVSSSTVAVHLWNECIKGFKNASAPRGSFLSRLHQEGE